MVLAVVVLVLIVLGRGSGGDAELSSSAPPIADDRADDPGVAAGDNAGPGVTAPAAALAPPASNPPPPGTNTETTTARPPAGQTPSTPATEPVTGATTPTTAVSDETPPAEVPSPPPDSPEGVAIQSRTGSVCLTGILATVFGGPGQVYFLTEDSGRRTQILLDERVAAPAGGFLALDRQRVTIRGEAAGANAAGDPLVRATAATLGRGCS